MPSSIFSFERAPDGHAGRTLLCAVAVAAVLLVGVESFLRSEGGAPSVPLSKSLMTANLDGGLSNPDPRTTLILGASRIRTGFSSRVFAEHTRQAPLYYLATAGESPLAMLVFLAEKTKFSGKLIVSMNANSLSGASMNEQQYIVRYFEDEWNWNNRMNHIIGARVSSSVVIRQENYAISNVLRSVIDLNKTPPIPYWRRNSPSGETFYDFSLIDDGSVLVPPALSTGAAEPADTAWEQNLAHFNKAVSRLTARGAQIALVRFPTSGNWWLNDQRQWPRDSFWDRIAVSTGAIKIHFRDVPSMTRFTLPDSSHLDRRDRDAFTRILLNELDAAGMTWRK